MQTLTVKFAEAPSTTQDSIIDQVKTFEDACRVTGIRPTELLLSGEGITEDDTKAIAAFHKLTIVAKALNEGWKPNWQDSDEYKYYPWFNLEDGFVFRGYDFSLRRSNVGSRLCFEKSEVAEYAGKQFIDLYKDLFLFS